MPQADAILQQLDLKYECSEAGNMERFVDQHQNSVRYVPEKRSWAVWDDTRYKLRSESSVFEMALDTSKGIFDEARDCATEEGRKKLSQWAVSSRSEQRLRRMLSMASKHSAIVANLSDFDTETAKLNCQNGLVNLETGELEGRSSSNQCLRLVPMDYKRHERCPTFNQFLHEIFNDDKELISWMQRAIGYTLTGLTTEQVFFIAYGTGANGKSTLFETLLDVLGDYGRASEFDTFLVSDQTNTRALEGVAKLQGSRFALASETAKSRRLSEALIKKLTGGDTVTGTFLYGSSFEFRPEFKLWLLANHLPQSQDSSHGFWRRVRVVPFARKFHPDEMDQTLRTKLWQEREGILAWCVRGAMNWFKMQRETHGATGLGSCAAVDDASKLYRDDNDGFGQFVDEFLIATRGSEVSAATLYTRYEFWCRSNNEQPVSQTNFGCKLNDHGIRKRRKNSGNVYVDVTMIEDDDDGDF
jgi:putative DNA primase/helicase